MDNMQSQQTQAVVAKTSGLAIASLILGICGFCSGGLTGIVGLILGIIALSAISNSYGWLKGRGLAVSGIVVSAVSLVTLFIGILMALLMPALVNVRGQARSVKTMANAHQLSLVMSLYCEDHNGKLPPADNWPSELETYIGYNTAILNSPFEPDAGRAWAMNPNLKTMDIKRLADVVLFFECKFGSPPAGGPELLPEQPRSPGGYVFAFADYSVRCVPPERLDELIWEPQ